MLLLLIESGGRNGSMEHAVIGLSPSPRSAVARPVSPSASVPRRAGTGRR